MENKSKSICSRGTDSAKIILVIETKSARGAGTQEDLSREVTQYWGLDGTLLAENDPAVMNSEKQEDV